jgi:hypothetical protein
MFSLKDIDSLSKFSDVLAGPLLACAIYKQYSSLLLLTLGMEPGVIGSGFLFTLLVISCFLVIHCASWILFRWQVAYALSGLVCIGAGLLAIQYLVQPTLLATQSQCVFYHLAALCFGLGVFANPPESAKVAHQGSSPPSQH